MSDSAQAALIQLDIKLFGAFRKFQNEPVVLSLPTGSTVAAVKHALWETLQTLKPGVADASLLASSALASAQTVLADTDTLNNSQSLAILPPVCGG